MSESALKKKKALASVAQWRECRPMNQGVTGLIPSQGTCLGCGPDPLLGKCKRQPIAYQCFSPSLSPSLPLSLKINTIFLKKGSQKDSGASLKELPLATAGTI